VLKPRVIVRRRLPYYEITEGYLSLCYIARVCMMMKVRRTES